MSISPLPKAVSLAEAVINELAASQWAAVTSRFDSDMKKALSEDALAAAWAQVIGQAGAYESSGTPDVNRAADVTVTNTPLNFEAGEFVARIAFCDDQSIAGLYILESNHA